LAPVDGYKSGSVLLECITNFCNNLDFPHWSIGKTIKVFNLKRNATQTKASNDERNNCGSTLLKETIVEAPS